MDNITDYNTSPSSVEQESCIDRNGREIPDGLLYTPGHDACQICTCFSGSPGFCRTVLCQPPSNCNSFRVKDLCCEWVCIDDVRPGEEGEPEHGGGVVATDLGLRLVACGVTAIFSLALLFFLIYRLRQRKMRNMEAEDRGPDGSGSGNEDQGSVDSVAMTNLGPNNPAGRGYMYGWMWWKPPEDFVCQPPPPSYDDAVAHDQRDYYYDEPDEDRGSSSGSEAPSYSQIHHDAVLQTHESSSRMATPNHSVGVPIGTSFASPFAGMPRMDAGHRTLPAPVGRRSHPSILYSESNIGGSYVHTDSAIQPRQTRSRHVTPNSSIVLPVGATLVLPQPAPPITDLHPVNSNNHGTRVASRNRRSHSSVTSAEVQDLSRLSVPSPRGSTSATSLTTSASVEV